MYKKLMMIQQELKCGKSQFNKFGNFSYRSCEDILEAVKPLLEKYGVAMVITDEIVTVESRVYVKATVILFDTESDKRIANTAFAREPKEKTKMDEPQITGTASSYARKYALNGLFLIDDTKDADSNEYQSQTRAAPPPKQQVQPPNQPPNQPSTPQQHRVIADLITQTNSSLPALLQYYHVQAIEQLSAQAADHAIKSLRGKQNA